MADYSYFQEKSAVKPLNYKTQSEETDHMQYRDLWPINPDFRDINRKDQVKKIGSVIVIFSTMIFHLAWLRFSWITIAQLGVFSTFLFFCVFRKGIFLFRNLFLLKKFDPFESLVFWQIPDDSHSIFFTNQADLLTVGFRVFRVEILPENVSVSIKSFVRAMASNYYSINYQVVHQPMNSGLQSDNSSRHQPHRTFIYFTLAKKFKGVVTLSKVRTLIESLQNESSILSSQFIADFHHYKISLLPSQDAKKALQTIFLHLPDQKETESDSHKVKKSFSSLQMFSKGGFILFISLLNGWLVSAVWNNPILTLITILSNFVLFTVIWWKEFLFRITSRGFLSSSAIRIIDPFNGLSFYRFKKAPHTIFFHSDKGITGGFQAFNARHVPQPLYTSENKLYQPLIGAGVSFSTIISAVPISFRSFEKLGYKKLTHHSRKHLCSKIRSEHERNIWLVQRAGMWKAEMIFSTQAYRKGKKFSSETLQELELELQENGEKLSALFSIQYSGCEVQILNSNLLESAVSMGALKTRFFRLGGTHLKYILIQGMDLYPFVDIDNAFKKGIETKIAAEFNTPLHLNNEVPLGHTINTEFLEQEVVAGFSLDQARRLLIMNGTEASRENTFLLLARNLITQEQPVIYFDFSGNGSKLINLLKTDSLQDRILHYSLGKTITVDPIHSELAHDPHNLRFLNLMLDAYALCFKKDEHAIAMFKNSLSQLSSTGEEGTPINFRTLSLFVDNQQDWKKSPEVSSILSTLEDLTEQDSTYLYSYTNSQLRKSTVLEFLKSNKSIIVDISSTRDLEKQCFFTWLILAKFIHYQTQHDDIVPKYFFIPNLDLVFDQYFLEKKMKYGKILKFFSPLLQQGHGFICTATQSHYLHSSIFSILENYVAFKTIDTRDISLLKNVLNLEELHGQGYYSKSRNEAYQVRYLMTLQPHEALMKRNDIYQPFPVEFEFNPLGVITPLSWKEIISHMKEQGYDIEDSERKILERAQKTVIEKDFGQYAFLIPEIITLLEGLQTVHQIGNLYRSKIDEELKHSIYPKLSTITKNKRQLKKMREEVLSILFSHGYLIENHPRQASGGQSIRTSFQVSPKFTTVLDDYYQAKQGLPTDVQFEVMAQETDEIPGFVFSKNNESKQNSLTKEKVQPILRRITIDILQWNLFQMHRSLGKQDYERCLKIGTDLPEMFVSNLQAEIERLPEVDYLALRHNFISSLCSMEGFPLTKEEVEQWRKYPQILVNSEPITQENVQEVCQKLYDSHKQFSFQLDSIIIGGND